MVSNAKADGDSYRPVHAVSMTGTFPGFARPHFTPADVTGHPSYTNTLYAQHIDDEKITSFDPLEGDQHERVIPLPASPSVRVGDPAVYVYAFTPEDAVVGDRKTVANAIAARFSEIEAKTFAACTAAQFAHLSDRLPSLNRRAFSTLLDFSKLSAYQWRDSNIFHMAVRTHMRTIGIPAHAQRITTQTNSNRLEVLISLTIEDDREISQRQLETSCTGLLRKTGLFSSDDVLTIRLEGKYGDSFAQLEMPESGELESVLKQAKFFLEERVFLPALRDSSPRVLNIVRNTRQWISRFEKIGDLIRYMERFRPDTTQGNFPFPKIDQVRFEDVYAEFVGKFGRYRGFQTSPADFAEGRQYSPFALSIFTRTYDNRAGGIRPIGRVGEHKTVVVNVTLSGGKYANEWLTEGLRLKCYLKSSSKKTENQYDEAHDANRSIMKYPDVPILLFTRDADERDFVYKGVFRYAQVASDEGGKWFELVKLDAQDEVGKSRPA